MTARAEGSRYGVRTSNSLRHIRLCYAEQLRELS